MNAAVDAAPPKTTLSLLELSSLTMALELHPQHATEVFAAFGLDDAEGAEEVARWRMWLDARPKEKGEHAQMRARMRDKWARWEPPSKPVSAGAKSAQASPPASAPPSIEARLDLRAYAMLMAKLEYATTEDALAIFADHGFDESAGRAELETWKRRLENRPLERARYYQLRREIALDGSLELPRASGFRALIAPITLEAYAGLCVELELDPAQAEGIFRAHGLTDADARVAADGYWRTRLTAQEDERRRFDELRAEYRAKRKGERTLPASADDLDAVTAIAASEPTLKSLQLDMQPAVTVSPTVPIASRPAPSIDPASVPNSALFEYAALMVELEINPSRADATYERLGIVGETQRRIVHELWQGRFARDPAAKAQFDAHVAKIRKARGVA